LLVIKQQNVMNKNGIYNLNVLIFKSKCEFDYMISYSQEIYLGF
jgi:hypothetical protein